MVGYESAPATRQTSGSVTSTCLEGADMSNLTQPAEYYARRLLVSRINDHAECVCMRAVQVASGLAAGDMTIDEAIDLLDQCERS